jgi:hypothetical protein
MDDAILQEIRKSHCAKRDDPKLHKCVGSCKITPKGIELSCPVCGDDKQNNAPSYMHNPKIVNRAKQICSVIGLEFDNMNDDVQAAIVKECFKDYCPNCFSMHMHLSGSYFNCSCGWHYSDYSGWKKPTDLTL